jgi:hypothetical protein
MEIIEISKLETIIYKLVKKIELTEPEKKIVKRITQEK